MTDIPADRSGGGQPAMTDRQQPRASAAPIFPALWFTSGTPMNIGQRDCAYARWVEFHAGRHGLGYRTRGTAVPLATGAAVHQGMELIGKWLLEWQQSYPRIRLSSE